jgi:hypothetical protein
LPAEAMPRALIDIAGARAVARRADNPIGAR